MAVKLRMQRHGSKKRPFYFIVAANSTSPRDGKFIDKLGTYNPLTVPATINLNTDKALDWLQKGAQPTHTVRRILSFKGVLYKKHLMRGVALGLFDEATALEKFEKWNEEHKITVAKHEEAHRKAKREKRMAASQEAVKRVEDKNAAKRKAAEEKAAAEAKAAEAEANEAEANDAADEATTDTTAEQSAEAVQGNAQNADTEKKEDTPAE